MDYRDLFRGVMGVVIAFVLRLIFAAIGFEIEDTQFNTLVGLIVAYFLTLFFGDATTNAFFVLRSKFNRNK